MSKVYIVELANGQMVYFGNPKDKPSMPNGDTWRHVPSSDAPPSDNCVWNDETKTWIQSERLEVTEKIKELNQKILRELEGTNTQCLCYTEQRELVEAGIIDKTDLTKEEYQKLIYYRYEVEHLLVPKKVSGAWKWVNGESTVRGEGGNAKKIIADGDYFVLDSNKVPYKVKSVLSDNEVVLTMGFQEDSASGNSSQMVNIDEALSGGPIWPKRTDVD